MKNIVFVWKGHHFLSFGRFSMGHKFGPFLVILGPSWGSLVPWGSLRGSWRFLGGFLRVFGASLGASWRQLGSKKPVKGPHEAPQASKRAPKDVSKPARGQAGPRKRKRSGGLQPLRRRWRMRSAGALDDVKCWAFTR